MFRLGPPKQIAYAVPNAFEAAKKWAEDFGAGPFFISEHIPVTDVLYRGTPATFDHTSAYGQWGDIMVELVQDHGTGPSVVRDLYGPNESGLHHLAYFVDDINHATSFLQSLGFELGMSAVAGPTKFNLIDATQQLGHFIELYEPNTALTGFYDRVKEASIYWDGENPIRSR